MEKNEIIKNIKSIIQDNKLTKLVAQQQNKIRRKEHLDFNIFDLISEKYHRENFHSDIIAELLNPFGSHKNGQTFLDKFIDLINIFKKQNSQSEIDHKDFLNHTTKVTCEKYKIDILIFNNETKRAIIIENKINDAPDTHRQLPNYVDKIDKLIKKENIVAIIYLTKDKNKKPDRSEWTKEEIEFIDSKYIQLVSFENNQNDLVNGWLIPCLVSTGDVDIISFIRQYINLLKILRGKVMDMQEYEDYYDIIKNSNHYETIKYVMSTHNHLPVYLSDRIVQRFEKDPKPFNRVVQWENQSIFEWFELGNLYFKIVVHTNLDTTNYEIKYILKFWDYEYKTNHTQNVRKILEYLKYENFNDVGDDDMQIEFRFPNEETDLYDFIEKFKKDLSEVPKEILD